MRLKLSMTFHRKNAYFETLILCSHSKIEPFAQKKFCDFSHQGLGKVLIFFVGKKFCPCARLG
jgi:hypothetical protein